MKLTFELQRGTNNIFRLQKICFAKLANFMTRQKKNSVSFSAALAFVYKFMLIENYDKLI